MKDIEATKHVLVPKHTKLSDKEKKEFLEKYAVSIEDLPKISVKDPAIGHLDSKPGDIIKIVRKSPTAGESAFYRVVINV
ncbi:DNA-directed RNA polymerase subunit H [Candidatus Woesearchaeota archaeon]|nr:DNA-directed RNA polymerase subunit H [Candidatus Woesearchaeota archaeon]